MASLVEGFDQVWAADFEFRAAPGERPDPICLVARELLTGREVRWWRDDMDRAGGPPYPVGPKTLFAAYYAPAELTCHLALGWPMPENVLDLYLEFRARTNGLTLPCGAGLLGALTYFGLDGIEAREKDDMRELAMRGGPYSDEEKAALLDYCASDVHALVSLLNSMATDIDLGRALLRGRSQRAVAIMEHLGVPIDAEALGLLRSHWKGIQEELIRQIDSNYGVFEGRRFVAERWARWLTAHGIPWPRTESGRLSLDEETFREMARRHPEVAPIRELRAALSSLRLEKLAVGPDGRNRTLLSPFRARTGRNQPSNAKFIFGPATWLRGLIRPAPGWGVGYVDWCQQEFGVAAALSGDIAMMQAYQSGDPYMAFAVQAGAAPSGATKESHGGVRAQFKATILATQYGMGELSLAERLGVPLSRARELLDLHRRAYPTFWAWSDAVIDFAMLYRRLHTAFGWPLCVGGDVNVRSLRNFPVQANGAECLRLACCLATEQGIRVVAPIHDALLIEARLEDLDDAVTTTRNAMAEASRVVLAGFELSTDVKVVKHPERYMDERGERMWSEVWAIISRLEGRPLGR